MSLRVHVEGSCLRCESATECRECFGIPPTGQSWRRRNTHSVHLIPDNRDTCRCGEVGIEELRVE